MMIGVLYYTRRSTGTTPAYPRSPAPSSCPCRLLLGLCTASPRTYHGVDLSRWYAGWDVCEHSGERHAALVLSRCFRRLFLFSHKLNFKYFFDFYPCKTAVLGRLLFSPFALRIPWCAGEVLVVKIHRYGVRIATYSEISNFGSDICDW